MNRLPSLLFGLFLSGPLFGAGPDLFAALREGNTALLETLLSKEGADLNQRDETGATALMYAAAVAPLDCMRLLLDKGADVNKTNPTGATALMWGAGDPSKVRLLLDRGANPGVATKAGNTALGAAARHGELTAVRLLLDRGASAKTLELIRAAFATRDPAMRKLLIDAGAVCTDPVQLGRIHLLPVTEPDGMKAFLSCGGNPNQMANLVTGKLSLVAMASGAGQLETTRIVLEKGADLHAANMHGRTPLMMAAVAGNPELLQLLLGAGADLHARDDEGRTALDWALTQGVSPAAALLHDAGARPGRAPSLPPAPVKTPRTPAEAIRRAIALLKPIGPIFQEKSGCVSCHNNNLPAAAMALAATHSVFAGDEAFSHARRVTLAEFRSRYDDMMLASCAGSGFVNLTTQALLAFREERASPGFLADAAVSCLATLQRPNGSWANEFDLRPPLASSPVVSTALALQALDRYSAPWLRIGAQGQILRGLAYLRAAPIRGTQDEVFKLLGLIWAGASRREVAFQAQRVTALQQKEGGWAQFSTLPADAFATGQALYALRMGGLSPADPVYRKGASWLLQTQLEDGSWYVRSRAFGFQPYHEYGFPHGKDQFIAAAATSWAVMALAYTL